MKYFILEPEVAGGLGNNTLLDANKHPPIVKRLQYVFDGWLGDELLESFPCFIATKAVVDALQPLNPSGLTFGEVEISKSELFEELHPDRQLPEFVWLKINGTAGRDDFGLCTEYRLVVSDRVLIALRSRRLQQCEIFPYNP
jgi:hypothetical protein